MRECNFLGFQDIDKKNWRMELQHFNHSILQITLRYIGIEEEYINKLYEEF